MVKKIGLFVLFMSALFFGSNCYSDTYPPEPTEIEKRMDKLERKFGALQTLLESYQELEREIVRLETRIDILERRWKIYEPDRRLPWDSKEMKNLRREMERLPLMEAMKEFNDALDGDDKGERDSDRKRKDDE